MTDELYTLLAKAARWTLYRMPPSYPVDVDELVNVAWIKSVRHLEGEPESKIYHIACKVMRTYIAGRKGSTRQHMLELDRKTYQLLEEYDKPASTPEYSYDDVDEILVRTSKLKPRDMWLLLRKLAGVRTRELVTEFGLSEPRINVILRNMEF